MNDPYSSGPPVNTPYGAPYNTPYTKMSDQPSAPNMPESPAVPAPQQVTHVRVDVPIDRATPMNTSSEHHTRGLVLNLLVLAAVGFAVASVIGDLGTKTAALVIFAIAYLIYLIEALCVSHTTRYLSNVKRSDGEVNGYLLALRNTPPELLMHVECYHYETRTRYVTRTDSDGKTHRETETYQEKVVTHRDSRNISFDSWQDESTEGMYGLDNFNMVKISATKQYTYADEHTRIACDAQRQAFKAENSYRDMHMDYTESFNVRGFEPRLMLLNGGANRDDVPCILTNPIAYVFATLFLLSWPFRMYIEGQTVRADMHIRKVVQVTGTVIVTTTV